MTELLRATLFHTPQNAFHFGTALRSFPDGALLISNGSIAACGDYTDIRSRNPEVPVRDLRGSFILPGFVDTHIHFPQVRIVGGLGYSLLDWLDLLTLPEEARFADAAYGALVAREFVHSLAAHGTTTALVFGSHFAGSTAALFDAAAAKGLRIVSGQVLADRHLREILHTTPDRAWRDCQTLIRHIGKHPRLHYTVIPRFALSAGEPMLEVCQALLKQDPSLRFTTHINESPAEIEAVASHFPWAADYLEVYEKFGLIGSRSVLAHNVHTTDSQIDRIAARKASVAHCPRSNAALGSGIFPLRRHLSRGAHFSLGTDIGGGTGFSMISEALQSYLMQRVAPEPMALSPAQMLYLATRAGAEALGMESSVGDFTPGRQADYVAIHPREDGPLANVLKGDPAPERALAALFTLARQDDICEVRVEGELVHDNC